MLVWTVFSTGRSCKPLVLPTFPRVELHLPGLGELRVRPTRKTLERRGWQLQNLCQGFGLLMAKKQRTTIGSPFSVCRCNPGGMLLVHGLILICLRAKELPKEISRALLMFNAAPSSRLSFCSNEERPRMALEIR